MTPVLTPVSARHVALPPAPRGDGRRRHHAAAQPVERRLRLLGGELGTGRHAAVEALDAEDLPGVRDVPPGGMGPVGAVP